MLCQLWLWYLLILISCNANGTQVIGCNNRLNLSTNLTSLQVYMFCCIGVQFVQTDEKPNKLTNTYVYKLIVIWLQTIITNQMTFKLKVDRQSVLDFFVVAKANLPRTAQFCHCIVLNCPSQIWQDSNFIRGQYFR